MVRAPVQFEAELDQRKVEAGQSLVIEGTVAALPGNEGQPLGSVHALVGGELLGQSARVQDDGSFRLEIRVPESWQPGAHTLTVQYEQSANFAESTTELRVTVEDHDSAPGSLWDAIERALRALLDWLASLFGGR